MERDEERAKQLADVRVNIISGKRRFRGVLVRANVVNIAGELFSESAIRDLMRKKIEVVLNEEGEKVMHQAATLSLHGTQPKKETNPDYLLYEKVLGVEGAENRQGPFRVECEYCHDYEGVSLGRAYGEGWITVFSHWARVGSPDIDKPLRFCGSECLGKWALKQAGYETVNEARD